MSDKKQTAVDLLLDKITDYEMGETLLRLIGKDEIDHIRNVEREQTTCKCDSRIGETKLWCCNQCGKTTEGF